MKIALSVPRLVTVALLLSGGSWLSAQSDQKSATPAKDKDHPEAVAFVELKPAQGQKVTGRVQFVPAREGLRVIAHVINLTPGQKHGFHVHEKGDLSAADLSSAGGHFNPTQQPHAGPQHERRHVGDLGNLEANQRGVAMLDYVDRHLTLEGANSIAGRAVIVHANPDDLQSQPSGNAGARIAGGIIERAKPQAPGAKAKK